MRSRLLAILILGGGVAHADPPTLAAHESVDLPITVGALGLAVLPIAIPVRHPAIETGRDDPPVAYAPRAAQISDVSLAATVAAPVFYLASGSLTDREADRLAIYSETLAIDLALVQVAKYVVQRPRPYAHGKPARLVDDDYLSFYSSHAAMSFGAAVAGAYLFGTAHADSGARAVVWGAGLASATFTANLRVRAGKHWMSDVVVGALVGTALGYAVPALHSDAVYRPSGADVALGGAGILTGAIVSSLLPLSPAAREAVEVHGLAVAPLAVAHGGGLAVSVSR